MQNKFAKLLLRTIKKVTKSDHPKLHEPYFDKVEIKEIKKCIESNFVSTAGPQVKEFEKKLSKLTKSKFIIAKGAVGSLDILEAAQESGISKVEYIGRKPPKAWKGSRAEKIINLDYLQKKSEVHFIGNAREASKLYPKNANVAATIALMGIGFEKTKVKLIADDTISELSLIHISEPTRPS